VLHSLVLQELCGGRTNYFTTFLLLTMKLYLILIEKTKFLNRKTVKY
jgi:hypothetical protein